MKSLLDKDGSELEVGDDTSGDLVDQIMMAHSEWARQESRTDTARVTARLEYMISKPFAKLGDILDVFGLL